MTVEIWYLFLTTVLLAIMWIPHIIGQVMHGGLLTSKDYHELRDTSQFPAWIRRANRAHVNLVEQFGVFLGLVVIANMLEITNATTALAATVFFWARVAHAIVFLSGIGVLMARTLVFTVCWLSLMVYAWQIYSLGF
ncbi:MAG: MAPEG family protein [Marinosulfonomonas sp.]|nr:MAPEG family protein [Marinosulfonomonas sp.]